MITLILTEEETNALMEALYTLQSEERESVHAATDGLKRGNKQSLVDYYQKKLDTVNNLIDKIVEVKHGNV